MTSKAHYFKNATRVDATELICSKGILGFQTFKLVFACIISCIHTLKFQASEPLTSLFLGPTLSGPIGEF